MYLYIDRYCIEFEIVFYLHIVVHIYSVCVTMAHRLNYDNNLKWEVLMGNVEILHSCRNMSACNI